MNRYGLLGKKLGHSFSPDYFKGKFEREGLIHSSYEIFEIPTIDEFKNLIQSNSDIAGLNVTVPYKEQIIPYLDRLDEVASEIGAVNTVLFQEGQLIGSNTDAYGFQRSLAAVFKPYHERALILGTGGASKAVAYTLKKLGVDFVFVSRIPKNGQLHYEDLNRYVIKHYPLIINTTPLGMFPDIEGCPDIPFDDLTEKNLLYDLVYNPKETLFLRKGKEKGAAILNGYRMLVLQAERSWELWNQ